MKHTNLAIGALTALVLATASLSGNIWASAGQSLAPQSVESKKPKPKPKKPPRVATGQTKEGVTTTGTGKVGGRLAASRPASKGHRKSDDGVKEPDAGHKPTGSRPTKESPATDDLTRVDFKLNIGICGRMQPDGTVPGPVRCMPEELLPTRRRLPREVVLPRPEDVTWEQILAETKVVLFPELSVKVQPKGRTLVNLDTIVYTDQSKVSTTTVTLLGFPVVVEATPISYSWTFGDGTTLTTSTPGKPYPSKEITHKYMKRGAVSLTLTTNYAARFNVANTGWQYVDGTIPVTGAATPLQVREAVPVLVDPGR